MSNESDGNPARWDVGPGMWLEQPDGSLVFLADIPDWVKAEARRRGVETPPEHVPKEDAEKWLNWRLPAEK